MVETISIKATDDEGEPTDDYEVTVEDQEGKVIDEKNGIAKVDSSVDAVDFQEADAKNVDSLGFNTAIDNKETATASSTVEIDASISGTWDIDVDQTVEFSFVGADTDGIYSVTLIINRTADVSITWASNVEWDGGTAPDLSGTGLAIITALTRDGGSTWQALVGGTNFS